MSLETELKELNTNLKTLISVMPSLSTETPTKEKPVMESKGTAAKAKTDPKPKTDTPAPKAKTTAKKPVAKKPVKADDSDKAENLIDQVRESLKNVVAKHDRKMATDILSEYGGATKLTELTEDNYENVILACDNALQDDQPEDEEDF